MLQIHFLTKLIHGPSILRKFHLINHCLFLKSLSYLASRGLIPSSSSVATPESTYTAPAPPSNYTTRSTISASSSSRNAVVDSLRKLLPSYSIRSSINTGTYTEGDGDTYGGETSTPRQERERQLASTSSSRMFKDERTFSTSTDRLVQPSNSSFDEDIHYTRVFVPIDFFHSHRCY
jgi:hypothetical protein